MQAWSIGQPQQDGKKLRVGISLPAAATSRPVAIRGLLPDHDHFHGRDYIKPLFTGTRRHKHIRGNSLGASNIIDERLCIRRHVIKYFGRYIAWQPPPQTICRICSTSLKIRRQCIRINQLFALPVTTATYKFTEPGPVAGRQKDPFGILGYPSGPLPQLDGAISSGSNTLSCR